MGGGGASALQGRGQEKFPPTPAGLRVGNQRGSGGLGAPRPQVTRAPGDRGDAGPVPACEPKSEGSEGAGIPSAHARDTPGSAQSEICSVQSRSAGSGLRRGLPALPGVSGHRWAPGARSTRTQKVRTPAPAASEAAGRVRSARPRCPPGARRLPPLSLRSERSGSLRARGEGRRRPRGPGPGGAGRRAREAGGQAGLGSAARARAGAAPGGAEEARRARGGGGEAQGREGRGRARRA